MYITLQKEIFPFTKNYKTAKEMHMICENNVKLN